MKIVPQDGVPVYYLLSVSNAVPDVPSLDVAYIGRVSKNVVT